MERARALLPLLRPRRGRLACLATLERLVASLQDGRARVAGAGSRDVAGSLPLLWEWIEDALVIVDVLPQAAGSGIERGDAVRAIDGRPVREAIEEAEARIFAATPQWRRWRATRELLLVSMDAVELEVESLAGETRTVGIRAVSLESGDAPQLRRALPARGDRRRADGGAEGPCLERLLWS